MSLPANYTIEALDGVTNSTDITTLVSIALALLPLPAVTANQLTQLESLTNLVQNITNFLPTLLAQGQGNNRVLEILCDYVNHHGTPCLNGSNVMVPSMLGVGIAVMVVVLASMFHRFH